MLNAFNLIVGSVLLVAGRKLFWLLVGGIGFIVGVQIAERFFGGHEIVMVFAGIILGIVFALIAIFLESIAIGIAGFLGGGYILLNLAGMFGFDRGALTWIAFIVGGILGVILVTLLFNWALITISSLAGASLIVRSFGLTTATAGLVYLGLVVLGVLIQGLMMRREPREAD